MRSRPPLPLQVLCWTAMTTATTAQAQDFFDDRLTVNAYGTVGVAMTTDEDVELRRSTGSGGPPLTRDLSSNFDTRLGLQTELHVSDQVDLVWQGLLQRNLDDHTRIDTKWAYLRLRPNTWLDLKLGRYMVPFYQISDQLYVGFAHPWARPPLEVYGLIGKVDHADGVSATARWSSGSFNYSTHLTWGQYEEEQHGTRVRLPSIVTGTFTVGRDNWNLRATMVRAPVDLDVNGARVFSQDDVYYYNLGYLYESADWLLQAEAVLTDFDDGAAITENRAWSLTLGRRMGALMPYATFSQQKTNDGSAAHDGSPLTASDNEQSTLSVGARWDFHPGYALKLQADETRVQGNSRGLFSATPSKDVRTYSLILDWVY